MKYNGKQIEMSKSEWENIGKKHNWKIAMPVPITEEQRRQRAQEGIYVMVDILDKLPNTGKRNIEQTIKNLQDNQSGIANIIQEQYSSDQASWDAVIKEADLAPETLQNRDRSPPRATRDGCHREGSRSRPRFYQRRSARPRRGCGPGGVG